MWKILAVLVLTALAILGARIAYDPPFFSTSALSLESTATATPPLMYAGIRG